MRLACPTVTFPTWYVTCVQVFEFAARVDLNSSREASFCYSPVLHHGKGEEEILAYDSMPLMCEIASEPQSCLYSYFLRRRSLSSQTLRIMMTTVTPL